MLSYPRRLQSGQITCYLNRTYHVLTTRRNIRLTFRDQRRIFERNSANGRVRLRLSFASEGLLLADFPKIGIRPLSTQDTNTVPCVGAHALFKANSPVPVRRYAFEEQKIPRASLISISGVALLASQNATQLACSSNCEWLGEPSSSKTSKVRFS